MFRVLLRLIVLVVVLVAAAAFFLGYWGSGPHSTTRPTTVGTSGQSEVERAREAAATVGQKTADAAHKTADAAAKAGEYISDGALTAKITSKMALDDSVRARNIGVTTKDGVVTLSGVVRSVPEHDRAVQLARETNGVTRVIDDLKVAVSVGK